MGWSLQPRIVAFLAGLNILEKGKWTMVKKCLLRSLMFLWLLAGLAEAVLAQDGHSLDASDGNPVDAVYVDSDGKVGIGTLTPAQRLTVSGIVESVLGGFKFPDGTTQTTASNGASGPAGGDLTGTYPNPLINPSRVVRKLAGFQGDVLLHEGAGIMITSGAQGPTITAKAPVLRTWTFGVSGLAPVQLGAGGPGILVAPNFSIPLPVYYFNEVNPGSTWTSGITSLPKLGEVGNPQLTMELFWVTSLDGGDVRWWVDYSARTELNRMNQDGSVQVTTPVSSTGTDRIYKTTIPIGVGFSASDEIFAFSLGRQSGFDTNTGKVGLLQIRFTYKTP
jgi:hypothetical protein